MPKGRQKGSKNKPGHFAGGGRQGSGRKRKADLEDNNTDIPAKKQKKSHELRERDPAWAPGPSKPSRTANKSPSAISAAAARNIYPIFRNNKFDVPGPSSSSPQTGSDKMPHIPLVVSPEITNPDTVPEQVFESIAQSASPCDSNITPELNDFGIDSGDADWPAEDTPAPAGIVEAYIDRIQKEVASQIDGKHKKPDCYRFGTFWIRPPDHWFALETYKDSPEQLYYPPIFVWTPHVFMPDGFEFTCVFCGQDKMIGDGWNSNPMQQKWLQKIVQPV
ncbi:hypothetical protein DFH07DRAFT_778606 [Mycena maculata]|uniref:Uncharacterized protein n=1 Tax=Mycena maculata TaxID=230809 RepID=A0AAD7N049_9AGAR|nr:hypothetical protein DFH07DRAFT_778606 [Mycena maculata]